MDGIAPPLVVLTFRFALIIPGFQTGFGIPSTQLGRMPPTREGIGAAAQWLPVSSPDLAAYDSAGRTYDKQEDS